MTLRVFVALLVGAVVCVIGALILGEYEFAGATPYLGGLLFGLVVSEFVVEIGKVRHPVVGAVTGVMVAAALGWAAWIASGHGLRPYPASAWGAMAIGGVVGGVRAGKPARPSPHRDVTEAG